MGQKIAQQDWAHHPLGPIAEWPSELRTALSMVLGSGFPSYVAWGRDLYTFYNDAYAPALGSKIELGQGRTLGELWPEVAETAVSIAEQALAGKTMFFENMPFSVNRHGYTEQTYFTFSYSRISDKLGKSIGIFGTAIETTNHVYAEKARVQALADLHNVNIFLEAEVAQRTAARNRLWQMSADLMLVASMDGKIGEANPAWTSLLGWPLNEVIGKSLFDFIHPDDLHHTIEGAREIAVGKSFTRFENRYRHSDGTFRHIIWTAGPDQSEILAVGRDATAEKKQAQALHDAEAALRQSQKMEAVGQLTGGLAHDFNNLLASISGGLQVLKVKLQRGQYIGLDRYIDIGESSVRRAASLTQRLLAFSRRQTLDPKPTNINDLVAGMDELLSRSMGPMVEMKVSSVDDLWLTKIDPPQLENALLNLCINARDAMMPNGGMLTLTMSNEWLDGHSEEHDVPSGEYVLVRISDTGMGMASEVLARMFDPFYTTKPLGEGTGLGLSMVYGFVRQSDGQVKVHSTVGIGTTMCLYLPRYSGAMHADVPINAQRIEYGQGEAVLLIEDESALRDILEEVLRDAGYLVLTAQDGPTGLQILNSNTPLDLLITDVGLPGGLNGRQVADAGRLKRPGLKVLFITGYANTAAVGNGKLDQGMEVMTKPFEISAFVLKARALMST